MLLQAGCLQRDRMEVLGFEKEGVLRVRYRGSRREAVLVMHLDKVACSVPLPVPAGTWNRVLDSAEARWSGPGSTVPANIESGGACTLSLPGESAVVLLSTKGGA
jgi:maltooligosyltrehalose trehalohydrolase